MPHANASSMIGVDLGGAFHGPPGSPDKPGGWWILDEPELHFGDDVLVPDLAGWRRERLPVLPNVAAMTLAPDWACEIVSPSTAAIDRARKMPIYARSGVGEYWIVDPAERQIEFLINENGRFVVALPTGAVYHSALRPEISLDLEAFWGQVERRLG
jgi:Uma2 family endonuclease